MHRGNCIEPLLSTWQTLGLLISRLKPDLVVPADDLVLATGDELHHRYMLYTVCLTRASVLCASKGYPICGRRW